MEGLVREEGCDLICILKRSLWLLTAKEKRIEISRVAAEGPARKLQIMMMSCLVGLWRNGLVQEMLGDKMCYQNSKRLEATYGNLTWLQML